MIPLMNRRRIILCLFLSTAIGCKSKVEAPPKPPLVPAAAVWAGGPDGGSFIECDVDEKHNVNHCLMYNDFTGDVEGGGFFQLKGLRRAALANELNYDGTDNERIYLAHGKILVPVQPIRPEAVPATSIFAGGLFISCGEPQSARTVCWIYRPDGGVYFQGTFSFEGERPYGERNPKYFSLSDRTIYLLGGDSFVSK